MSPAVETTPRIRPFAAGKLDVSCGDKQPQDKALAEHELHYFALCMHNVGCCLQRRALQHLLICLEYYVEWRDPLNLSKISTHGRKESWL